MGLFKDNETNKLNETQHGLKSQLVGGKPVRLFTCVAKDLSSELLRRNAASGQDGT